MAEKIAYEIEIKNIKRIADLKKELKELRKEQKKHEAEAKSGRFQSKKDTKAYVERAGAIKKNSKELRELNKNMGASTQATKKATKSSNSMAKQFVKGAAAIGILVGAFRAVNRIVSSIVSTFTEFEFVMSKVNAVSGATEREFAALIETAEELGRTTFFTATQVGELMLNFSKLGFTAMEIQDAVQPTLDLATATGSDLARAATVAGAAVRGFGLDASETERVVDVMAVSFSSSAMNIEKWQTSMTKVAPIAKAAGFSIEDTAAIMSKLTDSGIEASIAGTSLRNILLKMQDPTSELSKRFGRTIHSLDDLVPAMKQFISEGGSMADVMEVVDLRQAAAFEQMLTTADGTLELRDALLAAGGEGARMAGIVGDTLQGAFLKFTSALQGVSIQLMGNYAKGMQGAVENAAKFLNKVAKNIDALVTLIEWIKRVVIGLAAYKMGVVAITVAKAAFTKTTITATAAVTRFTAALARTGVGLLVIALGDLVYSLISFNKEAKEATDWTGKLNEGIEKEEKSIGELEISLNRLATAKETIDKFTKEEVKNMDKVSLEYAQYSKQLIIATQETRTLNTAFKQNGQDLITLQTDITDTQKKFSDLAIQMKNTAAVAVASQMSAEIIKTKMEVDNLMDDIQARIKEATGQDVGEGTIIELMTDAKSKSAAEDWIGSILTGLNDLTGSAETSFVAVKRAIEDTDISMGDFIKYAEKGAWYRGEETGTAMMNKDLDAINDKLLELFPNYEDFIKVVGEETIKPKGGVTGITDWGEKMKIALNAVKQERLDGILTDEQYKDKILETKAIVLARELKTLDDTKTNEKRILDIKTQALNIEMQIRDRDFQKKFEDLTLAHQTEKDEIIRQYTVNGQLRATGNQLLLQAEADYLIAKGQLHEDYKIKILNNNSEILKNDIQLQQSQRQILDEQISAYSAVGSSLQALAGDNEKLSKVMEIGIAITEAATLAQNLLNLSDQLGIVLKGTKAKTTLFGAAAENVSTGSILANTVAEIASLIPKAISAVLSSTKGLGPLGIFAAIAMFAFVKKLMRWKGEDGGVIPEYARGGMVNGKSHAQGGEKFSVGGRVVELEGGEAVINKRSTAMFRNQLSSMNAAGGGVKFADGGLLNMPSFTESQFNALSSSPQGGTQKVVVVEADITESQNTVGVIEANATF